MYLINESNTYDFFKQIYKNKDIYLFQFDSFRII